jgi:hypothetical protein
VAAGAAAREDWDVEGFHAEAHELLDHLRDWLRSEPPAPAAELAQYFMPDCRVEDLRPGAGGTVEGRGRFELSVGSERARATEGAAAAAEWLRTIRDELGGERRVKLKLFRAEPTASGARTRVRFEAAGLAPGSRRQQVAEWTLDWDASEGLRIAALRVLSRQAAAAAAPLFVDRTEAVFADEPSWAAQLRPGVDHWRERLARQLGVLHHGHHGLALGDVNGDGLEDLYACQPGGLPNRLLVHREDGTLRDDSARAGLDLLDYSQGALFLDADGDGDQDLFVATAGALVGFANDGTGRFRQRFELAKAAGAYSLAAADADGDEDLDLYVTIYFFAGSEPGFVVSPMPVPYHDARNGGPNLYLRNEGDWRFVDATAEVGLDQGNDRFSFAAAWEDHDEDGDPDLYVANDFGRNNLYLNEGGRFRDVASAAGVEDLAAGMSVAWGDPDRDGRFDLHVGNMFSAAGGRIAHQPEFHSGLAETDRAGYRRHARGNSLFRNLGDGRFVERSDEAGVSFGRWSWSAAFADLDHDGWEDLLVTNGFVSGPETDDL